MQQITIDQRHQTALAGAAMRDAGSNRLPNEGSLKPVVMYGLLVAGLAATQLAQASDVATGDDASTVSGVFGVTGMHAAESLDDRALESIHGRYVDVRALGEGSEDAVILWDERPGRGTGSDGKGAGKSLSTGLGNQQSTTVTTRRGQ